MANIAVTAANVVAGSGSTQAGGIAGATITAGETVYKSTTDSKLYLADCDTTAYGSNSEVENVYGVALNGASSGQPMDVVRTGTYTMGGTVVVGTVYVQSATAGKIAPWGDLVSTDRVVILGVGATASTLKLIVTTVGVAIP